LNTKETIIITMRDLECWTHCYMG